MVERDQQSCVVLILVDRDMFARRMLGARGSISIDEAQVVVVIR